MIDRVADRQNAEPVIRAAGRLLGPGCETTGSNLKSRRLPDEPPHPGVVAPAVALKNVLIAVGGPGGVPVVAAEIFAADDGVILEAERHDS